MKQSLYKRLGIIIFLISMSTFAQKQSKTFKEVFNVRSEAILGINISNADIEFETWNKDVIQVEAVIEIDGMSNEEAEKYFKRNEVHIIGNSKKVEVSTGGGNNFFATNSNIHFPRPISVRTSNFPENIIIDLDTSNIASFSRLKRFNIPQFDYEKYTKEGKKYMQKWQKEFEKKMSSKNQKEMKKWAEEMKNNADKIRLEALENKKVAYMQRRNALKERREAKKNKIILMERQKVLEKNLKEKLKYKTFSSGNSILISTPNTFYFSADGKNKHLKVKKTIKVKMPKSATIKMNVRHGKVKLAENTKNINANLSYASLLASTIDGKETYVNASYSPVFVNNWNFGELQVNYVDNVELKFVKDLTLSAVSSNVEIDKLLKKAFIKNDFGSVLINNISSDFETLDISVKNGELETIMPKTSYTIYVKGRSSKLTLPTNLNLNKTQNQNITICKGYNGSKSSEKSININSSYSEVVLK